MSACTCCAPPARSRWCARASAPRRSAAALDLGAGGVVVPMVNSAGRGPRMARAAKYPPLGCRSMGGDAALALWRRLSRTRQCRDVAAGAGRAHRRGARGRSDHGRARSRWLLHRPDGSGAVDGPAAAGLRAIIPTIARRWPARWPPATTHGKLACCNTYSHGRRRGKDRRKASTASRSNRKPIVRRRRRRPAQPKFAQCRSTRKRPDRSRESSPMSAAALPKNGSAWP